MKKNFIANDYFISKSGSSTLVIEMLKDEKTIYTITTSNSDKDFDFGCLYFEDSDPMTRLEELEYLKVIEPLYETPKQTCEKSDLKFVINLIKSKDQ